MPIFEYQCKKCEHVSAFLEKPDAGQKHTCENCGSTDTEKIFSTFAARSGPSSSSNSNCPTGTCPLG